MRLTVGAWVFLVLLGTPFYFLLLIGAAKLAGLAVCGGG